MRKGLCAFVVLVAVTAGAYAYVNRVSRLNTWELAFSSKPPRVMEVTEDGNLSQYTYIIYEVTNKTSEDIDFYPTFQMETDNGKVFTAGIYPTFFSLISERFGKEILPFSKIIGIIKPGETKKSVAIFKNADPASDMLTVYVAGLSGDFTLKRTQSGKLIVRYKTFKMCYARPGDAFQASLDPVTLKSTAWVWRE